MTPIEKISMAKAARVKMKPPRSMVFKCRLRALRTQHGLSIHDVAKALDMATANIHRIEHGGDVQLSTARKIAAVLKGR